MLGNSFTLGLDVLLAAQTAAYQDVQFIQFSTVA